ncbi:hypothetical protein ACJDU8_01850 [Clostridium sp. WILCCON 0269]|uniref:Uncharacterized protein n=1 Tax=Candidatus Clostridium eludens TaxID=3381663 RepID=A0ABW8SEM1_9CLOT
MITLVLPGLRYLGNVKVIGIISTLVGNKMKMRNKETVNAGIIVVFTHFNP